MHSTRARRDTIPTSDTIPASDDIVDLLLEQHVQIRHLFDRLQAARGADRTRLLGTLDRFLHAHEAAEQVVVHPVMRDQVIGGAVVARARVAEEAHVEASVAELVDFGVDHSAFTVHLAALRQVVFDHIEREEKDEFPRLRRFVPSQRLHSMANHLRNLQAMR